MDLSVLGWDARLTAAFSDLPGCEPARVVSEHKHACTLLAACGELTATCTGRFLNEARTRAALPAVGDWVAIVRRPGEAWADIHAVLPRRTHFSRRVAGTRYDEQVVAANVDTVLVVMSLDYNYNLRRLERFLAVAWESGAQPVVVLNKGDLHPDPEAARRAVERIAGPAPVLVLSALGVALPGGGCDDLARLRDWLRPAQTLALLGSSGVGKSTLVNTLLGRQTQDTGPVRGDDGRGRHTTTRRELIAAPGGAWLLDTPGMRELQVHDGKAELGAAFADIGRLAGACRYRDCQHATEPGCAIQAALADGTLTTERWASFRKLEREQRWYDEIRGDVVAQHQRKLRWKRIHADQRTLRKWSERNDL